MNDDRRRAPGRWLDRANWLVDYDFESRLLRFRLGVAIIGICLIGDGTSAFAPFAFSRVSEDLLGLACLAIAVIWRVPRWPDRIRR